MKPNRTNEVSTRLIYILLLSLPLIILFLMPGGALLGGIWFWMLLLLLLCFGMLFVWPGLMLWALIVFFIAGRGAPSPAQRRLALGRVVIPAAPDAPVLTTDRIREALWDETGT